MRHLKKTFKAAGSPFTQSSANQGRFGFETHLKLLLRARVIRGRMLQNRPHLFFPSWPPVRRLGPESENGMDW